MVILKSKYANLTAVIESIDTNKISVTNKVSFGRKGFKFVFLITKKYNKKYNEIWEKVKNGIKKEFDSEPV